MQHPSEHKCKTNYSEGRYMSIDNCRGIGILVVFRSYVAFFQILNTTIAYYKVCMYVVPPLYAAIILTDIIVVNTNYMLSSLSEQTL